MSNGARSLTTTTLAFLLFAPVYAGGVITQMTDGIDIRNGGMSLDDAGSVVIASSNANIGGLNPGRVPSIYSWNAVSGAATLLWSIPEGVRTSDSAVTDDGAWVAFISSSDLTGGNPSGDDQLFLRRTDGSETRQLSATAPGDEGAVQYYALAGSGNRAIFAATTDPLGTNLSHLAQLFIVDTDGTNLRQLTTTTTPGPLGWQIYEMSISDDGSRIVFMHTGDLSGGNADGSNELFAIDADGTNLRQLTSGPYRHFTHTSGPRLSGDGARIAFTSYENLGGLNPTNASRIWVVDWSGGGLAALPAMDVGDPSITDDGQYIFYATIAQGEIRRVRYDGTGATQLTTTSDNAGFGTQTSGDGSRVAFTSYGGGSALPPGHSAHPSKVMDGSGGGVLELAVSDVDTRGNPELSSDGTRLYFSSAHDPFGTNSNRRSQIFRMQTDGSGLAQITAFTDGNCGLPSISDDGQKITFLSDANPLGNNPNHGLALFAMRADGTQLTLLDTPANSIIAPVISGNGTWVVFQSVAPGHTSQLMRMSSTGTSPLQITNDGNGLYKNPRIDTNGLYVVYQNNTGIWRVTTSNTARQQIANYSAWHPDISGTGTRYVWVSDQDPLGSNPDGSNEIFSWDSPTNLYRQLTSFPAGSTIGRLRISRDGFYVAFLTNAPIFGPIGQAYTGEPYRLHVATGTIERIGGLEAEIYNGSYKYGDFVSISSNGSRMAFTTRSDSAGNNGDGSSEMYLVDMARTPAIRVSATSPTVVSWDADPHFMTYDAIRGDVAGLTLAGSTVDLGPVTCLGDDMSAMNTSYAPDPGEPASGEAFFYLVRGSSGPLAGPGSYGQGKGGLERVAGAGECAP